MTHDNTGSGTGILYGNGTAASPTVTQLTGTGTDVYIGARFGTPPANPWNGYVAEVIIYKDRVLPTTQRQQVEGYLAWKWGLQNNLPSDHPYRTNYSIVYSNPQVVFPSQVFPRFLSSRAWLPTSLSGLRLWIDASDRSSFTLSGTTVTAITDKSGTGSTVDTFDGTTVSWSSNSLNGRPAFNMTSGHFRGTLSATLPDFVHTTFIVTVLDSITTSGYPCMAYASAATGSSGFLRVLDFVDASPDQFRTVGFFATIPIAIINSQIGSPFVWSSQYSTTLANINLSYNGGTSNASASLPTAPTSSSQYFFVGTDSGPDVYISDPITWPGKVSEIIVYNTALTDYQRQQVEGYLAWKWNLASVLPTIYPFKNIPPSPPS